MTHFKYYKYRLFITNCYSCHIANSHLKKIINNMSHTHNYVHVLFYSLQGHPYESFHIYTCICICTCTCTVHVQYMYMYSTCTVHVHVHVHVYMYICDLIYIILKMSSRNIWTKQYLTSKLWILSRKKSLTNQHCTHLWLMRYRSNPLGHDYS